jgi:Trp operon repressor
MARISRQLLDERVLNKLFDLFFEIVGKKYHKEEFRNVILDLLSPVERIMIAKRIAIIYLILKKIDQRNISTALKVSNATVSKFAILMERSVGIVPAFKTILRNEKFFDFLDELYDSLFPPGTYGTNWKDAWQKRIEINRRKTYGI